MLRENIVPQITEIGKMRPDRTPIVYRLQMSKSFSKGL